MSFKRTPGRMAGPNGPCGLVGYGKITAPIGFYETGYVTIQNTSSSAQPVHVIWDTPSIESLAHGIPIHPYKPACIPVKLGLYVAPPLKRSASISVWKSEQPLFLADGQTPVYEHKTLSDYELGYEGFNRVGGEFGDVVSKGPLKGKSVWKKISPPVHDGHGVTRIVADYQNAVPVYVGSPGVSVGGGYQLMPGKAMSLDGNPWLCARVDSISDVCTLHFIRGEIGFQWEHPGVEPITV